MVQGTAGWTNTGLPIPIVPWGVVLHCADEAQSTQFASTTSLWMTDVLAADANAKLLTAEEFDAAAASRVSGELVHVDGATFAGERMCPLMKESLQP